MQQSINTAHQGFNAAANGPAGYVGTGNVVSANQYSFHVRAYHERACNGFTFAPGVLQQSDLKGLREFYPLAYSALKRELEKGPLLHQNGWVYLLRHADPKTKRPVIHGMILTTEDHKHLRSFERESVSQSNWSGKSRSVLDTVLPLVTH